MRRIAMLHLLVISSLALSPLAAVAAGDREDRKSVSSEGTTEGGSLDGIFDGVGDLFGDGESEPAIAGLDGTQSFAGIASNRRLSLRLLHGYASGMVAYPGFAEYVNQVLARLIAAAPVKDLPARAYVVASGNFGAGAMPCGLIFVDWGLLRGLQYEDELAFVLAHELGHIIFRHHRTDYFVDAQHYAVTTASLTDKLADTIGGTYGRQLVPGGELERAIQIGRITQKVSEGVLLPAWTREQEDVADQFGIDLMIRAGYNHASPLTFFATLDAWERAQANSTEDDASLIVAQQIEQGGIDPTSSESLFDDLLALGDKVAGTFSEEDHYPAVERRQKIQSYIIAHYGKAKMASRVELPWRVDASGALADAQQKFLFASEAYEGLAAGNLAEAEKLASAAVGGTMVNEGFPRFAFYMIRLSQGNIDKAKANLDYALQAPLPGVALWKARIQMAEREGALAQAAGFLDDARRRLDDPPSLLPDRIRLYPKVGRQNEVTPLLLECELRWREMAEECRRENGRLGL